MKNQARGSKLIARSSPRFTIDTLERPASPVQEIRGGALDAAGLRLLVKRDDLLRWEEGSAFCGNKWRKLKYNLLAAHSQGFRRLLSFGGAYSNHLAAVAEAAHVLGFESIGIVRGEATPPLNPTLQRAQEQGMQLLYVSRETYREKTEAGFLPALGIQPAACYVIPEGGTNSLALAGCRELAAEITAFDPPDCIAVACGTGGTLAGLVSSLEGRCPALGFSALKGDFLQEEVRRLLAENGYAHCDNWAINTEYHFGGYAKWRPELLDFMQQFKADQGFALDPIYTGKLFYGLFDLIKKGHFPRGATVMAVHTGGLQGVAGFEQRYG
ncbi:MAG: 1-aminocyclopropane-1-carboxylate deaminase/D-cysteine desulfhydrase [Saprospiraceae bacterium]|nr:1-aminocyclopropane-1-carboxylate deaminase/D-cysteine desulfhydrase [Saprospiraceae bacterium]